MTVNVGQIQRLLEALGHSPGKIDGIWGPKSQAALDGALRSLGEEPVAEKMSPTADWWKDIRYFKRSEFACKCGGKYCNGYPAEPKEAMVRIADQIREHFGRPARVISGLRCKTWNGLQGGVVGSQHMYGEACDLCVDGVGWEELLAYTKTLHGVRYAYHIEGSNNVHFDIPASGR